MTPPRAADVGVVERGGKGVKTLKLAQRLATVYFLGSSGPSLLKRESVTGVVPRQVELS